MRSAFCSKGSSHFRDTCQRIITAEGVCVEVNFSVGILTAEKVSIHQTSSVGHGLNSLSRRTIRLNSLSRRTCLLYTSDAADE